MSATARVRAHAPLLLLVISAAVVAAAWEAYGRFTDLTVYRFGGRAVLDAVPLYGADDPITGLPFTYPPFAALLMVPVAAVPDWVAAGVWAAASVAALAAAIHVVRRAQRLPARPPVLAVLTVAALALEPVHQHLVLGQVNLLLMAAVLVDLLLPDRRWSGVAVGVAAGVKLTPLVFVVLLVLVGRRTAAGRAVLAFLATVAIGFAVLPGSSTAYWSEELVDPSRTGGPAFATNQSAYGVLIRLLDGPPSSLLWLVVAGPVALGILLVGAASWRRGDPVLGTCLGGVAMLVASPISWSHHWVWAVPVGLWLLARSGRWAAAWAALFVAAPIWWPPHREDRELAWGPAEHLAGNAYVVAALVLAGWAALRLLAWPDDPTAHRSRGDSRVAAPARGLR